MGAKNLRGNHHIIPTQGFALLLIIPTNCHNGAVRSQAQSVPASGGDGNDVRPCFHIALTVVVIAHCHHGAVSPQANTVVVSGGNCDDITPFGYMALAVFVASGLSLIHI